VVIHCLKDQDTTGSIMPEIARSALMLIRRAKLPAASAAVQEIHFFFLVMIMSP
jgi:hypothetical protein